MGWLILALALWLGPTVLPGLVLLTTWYWPEHGRWNRGVEVVPRRGRLIGGPWVGGQTLGWFRFYRDTRQWDRPDLVAHETWHTWQFLIPGFPLWYGLAFLWQWGKRGFDSEQWIAAYRANWFEAQARRKAGQE